MSVGGCLFVVATPIGNLADFSSRGREVLAAADCIAAEDTRHSGKLLAHWGIRRPLLAYHEHSGAAVRERLLAQLRGGAKVALISDAGTPLISDPGYALVKAAREEGLEVLPVPGPCALTAALSVSGLATDRFFFAGFPPAARPRRRRWLEELKRGSATCVLFESNHRILDCVDDLVVVFGGDRDVFVAREMTKQFESHYRGDLAAATDWLRGDEFRRKGEFVLVLAGWEGESLEAGRMAEALRVAALLRDELPAAKAAALAAEITGVRKNTIYQSMLRQASGKSESPGQGE